MDSLPEDPSTMITALRICRAFLDHDTKTWFGDEEISAWPTVRALAYIACETMRQHGLIVEALGITRDQLKGAYAREESMRPEMDEFARSLIEMQITEHMLAAEG